MAQVKINRELLIDLIGALTEYHEHSSCRCSPSTSCVVAQRIRRAEGVIVRDDFHTSGAPV